MDKQYATVETKKQVPAVLSPESPGFQYVSKFKSALYASVLFILLSHKVAYKVLDLILKVFTNSIEVIDDNENPQILGSIFMALIVGLVVFLL
jgi:hypothetical protein